MDAAIEAYSDQVADAGLLPLSGAGRQQWNAGGHQVQVISTAHVDGGVEVRVSTAAGDHQVPPDGRWSPVRLAGVTGFWARQLRLSTGAVLLRTGTWTPRVAGARAGPVQRLAGCEIFAGEGLKSHYRTGQLGPRLVDGGDGSAEAVFVSSLECIARSFGAAVDAVLACPRADLVVIYLPLTDDIGHELVGWCDPASAMYRADVADAVWAQVARGYGLADGILGRVLDAAGPADTVLLGADHGIVGSAHLVALNQALIDAGLAARTPDGALDVQRSAVIYHPANNGSLRVNHDELPGGTVPRAGSGAALCSAMAVLAGLPGVARLSGVAGPGVVSGFLDAAGEALRPDQVGAGDDIAYVVLHDDFQPTASVDGGPVVRPMTKSAAHVVNTGSTRLQATVAARGPGLLAGSQLGVVDNTFGAALVLRQLGIGS